MAFIALQTHATRRELLSMELWEFERWYDVLVRNYNKLHQPSENG